MNNSIRFTDALKIEYLKIFIIYNDKKELDTEKTLSILEKCLPAFCNSRNKDLPLTIDAICDYLYDNNYEKAMVRMPDNGRYAELTFQRDLNEIQII